MSDLVGLVNTEYMHALRSAAPVFRKIATDLRKEAAGGKTENLINYLRSDVEINSAEREELADLLAGLFSRPPGRPNLIAIQTRWRAKVCGMVYALEARWRKEGIKRPFRKESTKAVSVEISRGERSQRATAEEIMRWLDRLPKEKRTFLQENYSK
jgi:hypothetical protein